MQPWRWLAHKERSLRDFNWSISGGIEPFNWLLARFNTSRLVNSPICGGISPDNLLDDRSRYLSLDRLLISIGTVPKSSFMLRSINARLGRDENENLWSVHFKVELARFNLITLPAWLQEMPNQLHGIELVFWLFEELVALLGRIHEGSGGWVSFWRVAFQFIRASASASSFKEREVNIKWGMQHGQHNQCNEGKHFFREIQFHGIVLQVAN